MKAAACIAAVGFLLALGVSPSQPSEPGSRNRLSYWDTPRRGGNLFNEVETRDRLRAAKEAGLDWVRLVPDKWKGVGRDFLLGDAGDFKGIVPADLAHLEEVLGWAAAEDLPVVMGMLNLPGARWVQKNGGKQDYRLWNEERYQKQAAAFWRELASKLKDHPAVVAYNPLNEPHPAREDGHDDADDEGFPEWLEAHRDTTADLDRFYAGIVRAIREVDSHTPILVEGYGHGSVSGLTYLSPVDDPAILYSFHFYDPWQYTSRKANKGRYAYPGKMPGTGTAPGEVGARRPGEEDGAGGGVGQAAWSPHEPHRGRRVRLRPGRPRRPRVPRGHRDGPQPPPLALGVLLVPGGRLGPDGLRGRAWRPGGGVLGSRRPRRDPGPSVEGQPPLAGPAGRAQGRVMRADRR